MQLADESHGHAVEAVARAEAVDEPELRAEELCRAAEARDRAGDDEACEDVPLDREAVETAGRHVVADGAQLKAVRGPEQIVVEDQAHGDRDEKRRREAHVREHAGELHGVGDRGGLRDVLVAQPARVNDAHEKRRNVVEHDGNDHLVLSARDFEDAGDEAPQAARNCTGDEAEKDCREAGQPGLKGDQAGDDGAHDELALAAEVKHAALVGEARAERREDERRRLGERRAEVRGGAERTLPQVLERQQRIGAQNRHDDGADDKGEQDREQRHHEAGQRPFKFSHIPLPLFARHGEADLVDRRILARKLSHELALEDDKDAVGHLEDFIEVGADEQDADAAGSRLDHAVVDKARRADVQSARGMHGDEQVGLRLELARGDDLLLVAA